MYKNINVREVGWKWQYNFNLNLLSQYRGSCVQKPKGTDWLTWAPYVKGTRKKAERLIPKSLELLDDV
jgi:hypothetical protein